MVGLFIAIAAILAFAVLVGAIIITRLIHICAPNEVLIFSGAHGGSATGLSVTAWFRVDAEFASPCSSGSIAST